MFNVIACFCHCFACFCTFCCVCVANFLLSQNPECNLKSHFSNRNFQTQFLHFSQFYLFWVAGIPAKCADHKVMGFLVEGSGFGGQDVWYKY